MDKGRVTTNISGIGRLDRLEQVPSVLDFLSDLRNVRVVEEAGYFPEKRRIHVDLTKITKSVRRYVVQDYFPSQIVKGGYEIISRSFIPREVRKLMG